MRNGKRGDDDNGFEWKQKVCFERGRKRKKRKKVSSLRESLVGESFN